MLGYFAQQSTGTVKTGLRTQILKNHFDTFKVKIMVYKEPKPGHFSKESLNLPF
jgi:hypothetical protein